MELDPWATKRKSRDVGAQPAKTDKAPVLTGRIAGYVVAFVAVSVIAFAGFEMLVLA